MVTTANKDKEPTLDTVLQREFAEAILDAAEFLRHGTPIHPGSDLGNVILSLAKMAAKAGFELLGDHYGRLDAP